MEHEIQHDLPVAKAQSVVRSAVNAYSARLAKYHPEVNWSSDRRVDVAFTANGIRLVGALEIDTDKFRVHLDVPLLLRPFKSRATRLIDKEAAAWIAKVKSGEL